jgi:hypothetical protein
LPPNSTLQPHLHLPKQKQRKQHTHRAAQGTGRDWRDEPDRQRRASTAVFQEDPAPSLRRRHVNPSPPPPDLQNPPKSQLSWATAPEALVHAAGVAPSCGHVLSEKTVSGTRLNSARESGNAPRQPRQGRHPGETTHLPYSLRRRIREGRGL